MNLSIGREITAARAHARAATRSGIDRRLLISAPSSRQQNGTDSGGPEAVGEQGEPHREGPAHHDHDDCLGENQEGHPAPGAPDLDQGLDLPTPQAEGEEDRFVIALNGLVYRADSVGEPVDLEVACRARIRSDGAWMEKGDFPEAEKASREVVSLPVFPELGAGRQEKVVQAVVVHITADQVQHAESCQRLQMNQAIVGDFGIVQSQHFQFG